MPISPLLPTMDGPSVNVRSGAMRVNVHFVASAVGRVTEVTATGSVDSLNRCMEAAIRRWHFSGAGEAALPFVFSPGN